MFIDLHTICYYPSTMDHSLSIFNSIAWDSTMKKITEATSFVLKGLTDINELQNILFLYFLVIYLSTVIGNVGFIILVVGDP